jgi:hypothetical protein
MKRRSLAAAAALAALCAPLFAQAAHRYVAVSLVSDELTYVGAPEGVTGTLHARGSSKALPLKGAPFDRTVLEVLAGSVPKVQPSAKLSFLAMSAPEAFERQEDWFDGDKVTLPVALRDAVAKEGAGEMLLITKIRGEAAITDGTTKFGAGKLSGLGFYIDTFTPMMDPELGEVKGYIAPYVYVKLSVIELATSKVTAHRLVQVGSPYTSLKSQEMMDALQKTLVDSLTDAVQRTLKPE